MKMSVKCVAAALGYERYEGKNGVLVPLALPTLGYQFLPNGDPNDVLVDTAIGWRFDPLPSGFPHEHGTLSSAADPIIEAARVMLPPEPPPQRRAREKYDAHAFAEELEVALSAVRGRIVEAIRMSTPQPHLPEGISTQDATLLVVQCLILRKMSNNVAVVALDQVFDDTRVMLLHKNAAYGDSALNPVRVFSKAPLAEQLLVRLDDKVSRLARGSAAGEDVAGDMLGYLVLVEMAERREKVPEKRDPYIHPLSPNRPNQ